MSQRLLSRNLIYSWWTHPIAVYKSSKTRFGGVMHSDGDWRIFNATDSDTVDTPPQNSIIYQGLEPDDHNAPSRLEITGKDSVVCFTRHAASVYLNYMKAPENTTNYGTKQSISFPGNVTYSQILNQGGDKSVIFVRSGQSWYYVVTENHFSTFTTPQAFMTPTTGSIYLNFQESETTPGLYHIAGAPNPTSTSEHFIIYGTLDFSSGDVTDGTNTIANIYSPSALPIDQTDLVDTNPVSSTSEKVRLLDVGDKFGISLIYYAKWDVLTNTPYYWQATLTAGVWVHASLGITAPIFKYTSSSTYVSGLALDRNGNDKIYICERSSGTSTVKKYPLVNTAGVVTLGSSTTLSTSSKWLVRPYPVRNANKVLFQELITYNSYSDYQSYVYIIDD